MSAPMPRPMRRTRWRCGKTSIQSSIRKEHATPIGSRSISCPWCMRCAAAESASIGAAAERARDLMLQKRDAVLAELSEKLGRPSEWHEIGSTKWKAETFDQHSIAYPRTAKGNPSFRGGTTGWMVTIRTGCRSSSPRPPSTTTPPVKFLEGHILGHTVNGRIYAEIHPHRSDDGSGTCSLRFSYSDPPLQQMPARDKELAPLVRGVFLPEEGEVWAKPDISQQEFRFVVHYAMLRNLPRAKEAADLYRERSRRRLPRNGRGHDRPRARVGEGRELRQDIRRRRGEVRGNDRQAAARSAHDLRPV